MRKSTQSQTRVRVESRQRALQVMQEIQLINDNVLGTLSALDKDRSENSNNASQLSIHNPQPRPNRNKKLTHSYSEMQLNLVAQNIKRPNAESQMQTARPQLQVESHPI